MNKATQRQQNAVLDNYIRKQILKGKYGYCIYHKNKASYYILSREVPYLKQECFWVFKYMDISFSAIREAIQRVAIQTNVNGWYYFGE